MKRNKIALCINVVISILFAWIFFSWLNVMMHDVTDQCYAWWNFFKICVEIIKKY